MALQNTKIQLASIVLAVVLSLAYLGNQQNLLHKVQRPSRGIASVGSVTEASRSPQDLLQLIAENDLAEELAKPSASRGPASVGQPANALENLRFGFLEGKYAIKMNGDHISEISFNNSSDEKPTIVPNRADFLSRFAEQFGAVSKPTKLSAVSKGDHLIETFRIKPASGPDRIVQVTVGAQNSLLALTTEEAPTLKLF